MAANHGKNGVVKIGANVVAEVRSFEIVETTEFAPAAAMGDANIKKVAIPAPTAASVKATSGASRISIQLAPKKL